MRLDELAIEKYGAFDRRSLQLGESAGLTIVYGSNEAGKSTCLSAVTDFLFGIPMQSPHGALFGYDAIRLGARLTLADGTQLNLRRRKGRTRTLTDETGAPIEDSVLGQILGSTTRDRFGSLFGLDHESLRAGGEQLLAADGEIGRLIVEAGGGLRSLMTRLDRLDAEADKLFATRRSGDRAYYKALDDYETADRAAKEGLLTREAYEKTRKDHEQAQNALSTLRSERQSLVAQTSRIERLVRVVPFLAELARLEDTLGLLSQIGHLPADFDAQVKVALRERDLAEAALTAARDRQEKLSARVDALVVVDALVAAEPDIRDIARRCINVEKERGDRPNRRRDIAEDETKLAPLRDLLRLGPADDIAARLPPADALARVQDLVNQALERRPALTAARLRLAELRDEIETLDGRIATAIAAGQDKPFGVAGADLASLPARHATWQTVVRKAQKLTKNVEDWANALGFADVSGLRALPCPVLDLLRAEIASLTTLETARDTQAATLSEAIVLRDAAATEIERLRAGAPVASDAALAAARQSRASAWAPIREAHLSGEAVPSVEARAGEIRAFEGANSTADDLADRRNTEAQRIADLSLSEKQLIKALGEIAAAEAAIATATKQIEAREKAFERSFPQALALHGQLPQLLTFVEDRRELLARSDEARLTAEEAERLGAELAPLLASLSVAETKATLVPTTDAQIGPRVQAAQQAIGQNDAAHSDYRHDVRDRAARQAPLATQTRLLADLEPADKTWRSAWGPAVVALGLSEDVTPERAGDVVNQWAGARGVLGSLANSRRRLERMDEDEAKLAGLLGEIAVKVDLAMPADSIAAAQMLQSKWDENNDRRVRRAELAPEVETVRLDRAKCERELAQASQHVSGLAVAAGTPEGDDEALRTRAGTHADERRAREARDQVASNVTNVGDGHTIDELRAEWAGRDIDTLRADLAAIRDRAGQINEDIESTVRIELETRVALAGYEDATAFGQATVRREAATAQMHGVIERYLDLTLARELITRAIAKVRGEQQDPLVKRAGEFFAKTTRGEFAGVEADVDDKGQPVVVGARRGGGQVSVSTMSDGTRDQLFLAFRLASLENYCASTEPLPFIADDILVHFDDDRSAATLDLLADFCGTTQVLLFTHHKSVRHAAERLVSAGRANIVELSGAVGKAE